jgi:hypothetical protein
MTDMARRSWSCPAEESQERVNTAPVLEFACHEGNYALEHILSGARAAERASASTKQP